MPDTITINAEDVKEIIYNLIDDAIMKRDRTVSVSFYDFGTNVSVYPFTPGEEEGKE